MRSDPAATMAEDEEEIYPSVATNLREEFLLNSLAGITRKAGGASFDSAMTEAELRETLRIVGAFAASTVDMMKNK